LILEGGPTPALTRPIGESYEYNYNYYDNYTFGCINRFSSGYYIRNNTIISGGDCCQGEIVIDRSISTLGFQAFKGLKSLFLKKCSIRSVIMHDNMTYIDSKAFFSNWRLSYVKFSSNLTFIGKEAFMNTGLSKINLPNSLVEIKSSAFQRSSLTDIVIPDSVITIGPRAFEANNLTSVTLSSSLKRIGWGAFSSNIYLKRVTIPKSVEIIDNFAFNENDKNFCLVYEGHVFQYPRCKHTSPSASSWFMTIIKTSLCALEFFAVIYCLLFLCLNEVFYLIWNNYCYFERRGAKNITFSIFGDNNTLRALSIALVPLIISVYMKVFNRNYNYKCRDV